MQNPVSELYEQLYQRSIFRWQYEKISAEDTGVFAGDVVEHLTHSKIEDWGSAYEYVLHADKMRPWEEVSGTVVSILMGIGLQTKSTTNVAEDPRSKKSKPENHFFVVLMENNNAYDF